jgi:hypothetical protein
VTAQASSHVNGATPAAAPAHGLPRKGVAPATDDAGPVALVCFREAGAEFTYWETPEQAAEAERELTPCDSTACVGLHAIVTRDEDRHLTVTGKGGTVKPAPTAPVVRRIREGSTRLIMVPCPWCLCLHTHRLHAVGTTRQSPCHGGPYRVTVGADDE